MVRTCHHFVGSLVTDVMGGAIALRKSCYGCYYRKRCHFKTRRHFAGSLVMGAAILTDGSYDTDGTGSTDIFTEVMTRPGQEAPTFLRML